MPSKPGNIAFRPKSLYIWINEKTNFVKCIVPIFFFHVPPTNVNSLSVLVEQSGILLWWIICAPQKQGRLEFPFTWNKSLWVSQSNIVLTLSLNRQLIIQRRSNGLPSFTLGKKMTFKWQVIFTSFFLATVNGIIWLRTNEISAV